MVLNRNVGGGTVAPMILASGIASAIEAIGPLAAEPPIIPELRRNHLFCEAPIAEVSSQRGNL
jgi:hypothetical protein